MDHHQYLLSLLSRYQPLDAIDDAQRDRIKTFVVANPVCFERTNRRGHITGSAWLVDSTGTKVLLTHHKKLNMWLQLGGHSDGNPNTLEVALREAKEESGLVHITPLSEEIFDLDVHFIPALKDEPNHHHYDIRFLLKNNQNESPRVSNESHDLQWVPIGEIEQFTKEPSILRMKKKWLLRN